MDRSKKIILILIGVAFLIGGGIRICYNRLESLFTPFMNYDHSECYQPASATSVPPASEIQIAWLNGSVQLEYGAVDSIQWQEEYIKGENNEHTTLHYWMDGHTLYINYIESGTKGQSNWRVRDLCKDLVVTLPQDYMLDEIEVHNINGEITCTVDAREINLESVNGSKTVRTARAQEIKISGVNGSEHVYLPSSTAFETEVEKVNGSFYTDFPTQRNGKKYTYGNPPYVEIDMEVVNGDLAIYSSGNLPNKK